MRVILNLLGRGVYSEVTTSMLSFMGVFSPSDPLAFVARSRWLNLV